MGVKWGVGITNKVEWGGKLCAEGCLHAYRDLDTALFARYIHCPNYELALICETPEIKLDDGVKIGTDELTGVRWVSFRNLKVEEIVEFAALVYCHANDLGEGAYVEMMRVIKGEKENRDPCNMYKWDLIQLWKYKEYAAYKPLIEYIIGRAWKECKYNEWPELFSQVARKVISGEEIEHIDRDHWAGRWMNRIFGGAYE